MQINPKFQVEKKSFFAKTPLWSQSGSILLLGAFTILISKSAPFFSPLLLVAFIGYVTNLIWEKKNFYFSLIILASVLIYTILSGVDLFWTSSLSISIALSWLLVFLGRQESEAVALNREEEIKNFEKNQLILEKQLYNIKASLAAANHENLLERELLNDFYQQALLDLKQVKQSLLISEKEREKLDAKCVTFSQDICAYQRKEIAFQQDLDDLQTQLLKLKNQQFSVSANVIPQEENDPQEKIQLKQAEYQYALLREQFGEKSETLDKTRLELFRLENEFLALQRIHRDMWLEPAEEDLCLLKDLKKLEEEYADLEIQISFLQKFISVLLGPKKRISRSRKSLEKQEQLPFLIQEKINRITTPIDRT